MRRRAHRRALSMTPLIDVIFLLLLFFMLSSTFTRFSDVEMEIGGGGGGATTVDGAAFLRLAQDQIDLNGGDLALHNLTDRLEMLEASLLIISVLPDVSAQRLTDLLVTLRDTPDLDIVLLGDE